ncbi:synembryn-A-like isoform X2 [Stegodyphus dumicola]|uniref:synembryn-A-like isoform X2 n=1 Tax=Stegodyphus dumicola TaxID=202533 RepID=UPI0015AEAF2D|nr:synembryn-A-like isoform X2 [Stegodyphus dumicola]
MKMDESVLKKLETSDDKEAMEILLEFNKQNAQTFSFSDINLSCKKRLVTMLFKQVSNYEKGRVICLASIRILSREKIHIEELFNNQAIGILVNLAGLIAEEEEILNQCTRVYDVKVMIESQKCLCNLIYNSSFVQKTCCNNGCIEGIMLRLRMYKDPDLPHDVKFFDMRMLFLLTALCAEIRPKVRKQLHGLTYLMEVLDLILKNNVEQISQETQNTENRRKFNKSSKRGRSNQNEVESCYAPCLSEKEIDMACEVLKVLFNLTVNVEKYNMEEEEEAHYMRLVSILHDILLSDAKPAEKKEELLSHTIDLLTNMPMSSYEELLTPVLKIHDTKVDNVVEFDGMNMEAICVLLNFLDKRLDKPHKTYKEILSPVVTTLSECARSHSTIRKFLRKKVLPPLKDVMSRPEEGPTLRNRLVKLMTSPVFDVKELVADFLFVLCKENVGRLIKYTGYGNAAGLLANRGLMLGGKVNNTVYSSESEDSDTEEYLRFKDKINPVLGCYQEPQPNPMEGMTEEQKEYEAMQLVNMMDKMSRDGLIQPMRVGDDGKPHPINHVLELQEQDKKMPSQEESDSD